MVYERSLGLWIEGRDGCCGETLRMSITGNRKVSSGDCVSIFSARVPISCEEGDYTIQRRGRSRTNETIFRITDRMQRVVYQALMTSLGIGLRRKGKVCDRARPVRKDIQ